MSDYAEIENIKHRLITERTKIMAAVAALSPADVLRPLPDGWSAKDILAHLANSEAVNVKFARLMLSQNQPVQLRAVASDYPDFIASHDTFTLDEFNAYIAEKWRITPWSDVLSTLQTTRNETLAWLESLTPAQLDRSGEHAVWGDQTVRGMLKILVIHDKLHTQDLARIAGGLSF